MANRNGSGERSKLDSRKVALEWLELGILPVPLKGKQKAPKGGKGWNKLRVTRDTIPEFFGPGDNVGGLWGEPSNWIIDVDLDWDEASDVAELLLPETFTYGRLSRPRSHYLYRVKGIAGSKRTLKSGAVIAEVRSSGSQSVLPPSMHPDNERYEINDDLPFKNLSRIELERCVSEVAAAALLIREFPDKGSRHDYIHAITGALMWSGWEEKKTRAFVKAIIESTELFDDDRKQRERTINNTIQHFKEGDRIAGWKTLSQWLDGDVIQSLRSWLAPKAKYEPPPTKKAKDAPIEIPPFDLELLKVPGLVGRIARWSGKQSYLQQPAFDLSVGLMCTALASCNKYLVQGFDTPLQPYFMLLAPTAAGKGNSLKGVYAFATKLGLGEYCTQGFQSWHSLLDQLAEPPNMACWLFDEAARRLASAKNMQGVEAQVVTHLLSLYGMANDEVAATKGRKNPIPALHHPFLTVMATAQPHQLIEAVTVSDLAQGLINRFVLFDSGDVVPFPNWEREHVFPSEMKKMAMELKQFEPRGDFQRIKFQTPQTYALFQDFHEEARTNAAKNRDDGAIWGRANQNALILAGLVAVGVSPKAPLITADNASWAVALVRWSVHCWLARAGDAVSSNRHEAQSKLVEKTIRRARSFIGEKRFNRGSTQDYLKAGMMPRGVLIRLCRGLNTREMDGVIDQLIEGDLIGASTEGDAELYWTKG